jgi:hypothetical protein
VLSVASDAKSHPRCAPRRVGRATLLGFTLALGATSLGCGSQQSHDGQPGSIVDTREVTEVTVLGPPELVNGLTAAQMTRDTGGGASAPDGTKTALFRSSSSADWSSTFVFSSSSTASTLNLQPWICPLQPAAIDSVQTGFFATEGRTIEIDASGRFWTNGRVGYPFLSSCTWASSASTGSGIAANQDGPSFCDEALRHDTQIELFDAAGKVVSTPSVCVARFGADNASPTGSAINISLIREKDSDQGPAMEIWLYHCLEAGQSAPFDVSADDFARIAKDTRCQEEAIVSVGELGSTKPEALPAVAGSWHVTLVGPARDGRHSSDIDLTFSGTAKTTYFVRGHVELPEVLF